MRRVRLKCVIEPRDLVKAIYMVDLEHVSSLWNGWEAFEAFVMGETFGNGMSESTSAECFI
jgi:hypothetical protein